MSSRRSKPSTAARHGRRRSWPFRRVRRDSHENTEHLPVPKGLPTETPSGVRGQFRSRSYEYDIPCGPFARLAVEPTHADSCLLSSGGGHEFEGILSGIMAGGLAVNDVALDRDAGAFGPVPVGAVGETSGRAGRNAGWTVVNAAARRGLRDPRRVLEKQRGEQGAFSLNFCDGMKNELRPRFTS